MVWRGWKLELCIVCLVGETRILFATISFSGKQGPDSKGSTILCSGDSFGLDFFSSSTPADSSAIQIRSVSLKVRRDHLDGCERQPEID
jgi:uncharacterized membrane protein YqiK